MNKFILFMLAFAATQISGCSAHDVAEMTRALNEFSAQQNQRPAVNYPTYTQPQVMELQPSRTYDHYYCRNTGPITSCKEL